MKKYKYLLILAMLPLLNTAAKAQFAQSKQASDNTLEINRSKIDSLDRLLIKVIGEREKAVREIGIYKAKNNIPPLQAARFQQVLEKGIAAGKEEGLSAEFVTEILNSIHKESLRIEEEIKQKH
jgi:chorismate mutase